MHVFTVVGMLLEFEVFDSLSIFSGLQTEAVCSPGGLVAQTINVFASPY